MHKTQTLVEWSYVGNYLNVDMVSFTNLACTHVFGELFCSHVLTEVVG